MSWSVQAVGRPYEVEKAIAAQIGNIKLKLNDEGEMETVRNVGILISQTLKTFKGTPVKVEASGSMGYGNWQTQAGRAQSVNIKIEPIFGWLDPPPPPSGDAA